MSEESFESKQFQKFVLFGLAGFVVVLLVALYLGFGPRWYQGYGPVQPIPFSHKVHAGQYEIPCLYCHAQAEYAAFAAVPGLETCMNCHQAVKTDSPWIQLMQEAYQNNEAIAWVKVHVLPDFVHFNHQKHVAAGIDCQICHGPVEEMDVVYQWSALNMGWCMDCHRSDNYLTEQRRELEERKWAMMDREPPPFNDILGHPPIQNANVSCSTCHY
jgi:hypothetical protein